MSTALIDPRGAPLQKTVVVNEDEVGRAKIVGLSPWKDRRTHPWNLGGASVKAMKWDEYFDMYSNHAMLRAAIDKIAKSATNVGFDIVPRDSLSEPDEAEVQIIKEFFDGQADFSAELRKAYKQLLICGDAYLYIIPNRKREPIGLRTLHPKTVHVQITPQGRITGYVQKNLDEIGDDSEAVFFEPHEIIHIKIENPNDDIYGLSPLESLKWAVGADLYAQRYNAAFFANSGVTGTIIGVRNADPAEIQRNRKWLEENYMGPEAAHKPIILEGESISISKSVATHTEMGFLEGRTFIIQEILAVLDVPPAKLGRMDSANRSNSKEQDKTFRTESVAPLQWVVEAAINGQFVWPILGATNTKFVHSEGDMRDQIEQMKLFTDAEAYGIMNPNEIRRKLGMAPVDGGDTNFIMTPTGAVPLDRMDLYFQMPQQNTDKIHVGDDPPEGEPTPKPTPNSKVTSTIKSLSTGLDYAANAYDVLSKATTKSDLALAYSFLDDANQQMEDDNALEAQRTLHKALQADDAALMQGYLGRAIQSLSSFSHLLDGEED
jgi:HK97 family phage portal protein